MPLRNPAKNEARGVTQSVSAAASGRVVNGRFMRHGRALCNDAAGATRPAGPLFSDGLVEVQVPGSHLRTRLMQLVCPPAVGLQGGAGGKGSTQSFQEPTFWFLSRWFWSMWVLIRPHRSPAGGLSSIKSLCSADQQIITSPSPPPRKSCRLSRLLVGLLEGFSSFTLSLTQIITPM